jgi:hypothetical protein
MLCIKEIYAPGDSRANMDYGSDALDQVVLYFGEIRRFSH